MRRSLLSSKTSRWLLTLGSAALLLIGVGLLALLTRATSNHTSYEQYYQSVRRCYRFGQKRPVRLDVIATEGECRVIGNMRRKADKANAMFESLVREMTSANRVEHENPYVNDMEDPPWLSLSK